MTLRVSLGSDDVVFLDAYARTHGHRSRAAVLQEAVRLLRSSEFASDYADAWKEWSDSGEAEAWDATSADGPTSA